MFSSSSVILSDFGLLVRSYFRLLACRSLVRPFVSSFFHVFVVFSLSSLDRSISFIHQILGKTNHERTTLRCEVGSTAAGANFSIISFIRKMSVKLLFVAALFLLALAVDPSSGTFCDQGPPGRYCYKDLTGWYDCVYDSKTKTMNQTKHECPANTRSVREPKQNNLKLKHTVTHAYPACKVSAGKVT